MTENERALEKIEKDREKLEQEKLRKKAEKMSLRERITIPEICIMSSDFRPKEKTISKIAIFFQ